MQLIPENRIAILLHEGIKGIIGKTGLAYLRYGQSKVVAVIDSQCAGESLSELTKIPSDTPIVENLQAALKYNPDVLLIGIAPPGGALPPAWWEEVKQAYIAGLSIVNGLHTPLASKFDSLKPGQWIWDIRQEPQNLGIASGKARWLPAKRVLTVGTDMSIGKMSTSLELNRSAQKMGIKSKFIATGQTGLMIGGDGVALDAVKVDFAAGAVEKMVLTWGEEYELLTIEGQGSFIHPGSTATLPLIRGSQPTALVLVHRAGQKHINRLPDILIPPLPEVIKMYEIVATAGGAFTPTKVKAIALNTFHLDEAESFKAIQEVEQETGLPCTDVVRFGAEKILQSIL